MPYSMSNYPDYPWLIYAETTKNGQTKAENRLWTKNAVIRTRLYHVYNPVRQYFELYRPFDDKLDGPIQVK